MYVDSSLFVTITGSSQGTERFQYQSIRKANANKIALNKCTNH